MSYDDSREKIRRGIRKSIKKDRENWKNITDDINKRNEKKKEMVKDPETPKPYKTALEFEDINSTFPEVKKSNRRKK